VSKITVNLLLGESTKRRHEDAFIVKTFLKDGRESISRELTQEELPTFIGKNLAKKIEVDYAKGLLPEGRVNTGHVYQGLDLKVGGEGMKGFYDHILPSYVNGFVKRWGAKVEQKGIQASSKRKGFKVDMQLVHYLKFTPDLKRAAMKQGFPLFTGLGVTGLASEAGNE